MNISQFIINDPTKIIEYIFIIKERNIKLNIQQRHRLNGRLEIQEIRDQSLILKPKTDDTLTAKLFCNENIKLYGSYQGIKVVFFAKIIKSANASITTSIPEKILWLQRRNYFRTAIPKKHSKTNCDLHISIEPTMGDVTLIAGCFKILEMSAGGLSFVSHEEVFNDAIEHKAIIITCHISLNSEKKYSLNANICNINRIDGGGLRIGLRFIELPYQLDSIIQKYTQDIQLSGW